MSVEGDRGEMLKDHARERTRGLHEMGLKARREQRDRRQAKLLGLLDASGGDLRSAAQAARVPMATVARWRMECPEFAEATRRIEDEAILVAECRLRDLVNSRDESVALKACMFFLSSRGNGRWGFPSFRRQMESLGPDAASVAAAMREARAFIDASVEGPSASEESAA